MTESVQEKCLTRRERDVLLLIGEGRTTKEIAVALNLSHGTIGNYRKGICKKLDLHSTAELAVYGAYRRVDGK